MVIHSGQSTDNGVVKRSWSNSEPLKYLQNAKDASSLKVIWALRARQSEGARMTQNCSDMNFISLHMASHKLSFACGNIQYEL